MSNNLISQYSDTFALARTADQVEWAIKHGKIASLFGLEGAHMLGNSLGGRSTSFFFPYLIIIINTTRSVENVPPARGEVHDPDA